jgi:hypothetical protein
MPMKRRELPGLMLLLLAALVIGCGAMVPNRSEAPSVDWGAGVPAAPQEAPVAERAEGAWDEGDVAFDTASTVTADRMIVYTGNLSLVVRDTDEAQRAAIAMAEGAGGFVSAANSYAYAGGLRRISLTLRVPAVAFNATMDALRDLAMEISQDSISSDDVTQEYVDLESRLKALEVKAARLETLMDQAEDTEAVLAVYRELSSTQIQIEETKGRMRYLERVSSMATITVNLVPDELSRPVEIAGWRPQGTVRRAVEALIGTFQFLADALIWIILLVVPVLLVIGLVIYGVVRLLGLIFGRGKRKQRAAEQAQEAKDGAA